MIKNFNKYLTLTSQNPVGFLTFLRESGDPSMWLAPEPVSDVSLGVMQINGLDISQDASLTRTFHRLNLSDVQHQVAAFTVTTQEIKDWDAKLTIKGYSDEALTTEVSTWDVSVYNRPYIVSGAAVSPFESGVAQTENDAAYMMMRTNPKLSGNIKIMVSENDEIYLDTFKVSDILSNRFYRRQPVSGNSFISGDMRRVFSALPKGEIYRLDAEDTLDVALPKTRFFEQYSTTYSYGARLLVDDLYDEPFSMLAPLWLNNKAPDYFAVFRVPGTFNPETYTDEETDFFLNYLKQGEMVKSWSFREGSGLGRYVNHHLEELKRVVSPVFLSLTDPNQRDADPNTWYGISIDAGIITGGSETTYEFDKRSDNFTALNEFVTSGFERLNLLCPNLLNLEFAFFDETPEEYTMNRYFGLYLTENPLYRLFYYSEDGVVVEPIALDEDPSVFFNSSVFDASGNVVETYKSRIFALDDNQETKRFTNVSQADGSDTEFVSQWTNRPGPQLFAARVQQLFNVPPFVTMKLERPLNQGEHLRLIDTSTFEAWEVFFSDSDLVTIGECLDYAVENANPGYPTLRSVTASALGGVTEQTAALLAAWQKFAVFEGTPFRARRAGLSGVALTILNDYRDHTFRLQRITSQTRTDITNPSSPFNSVATDDDVTMYGSLVPDSSDFEVVAFDSSYGPIGFELFGDRRSVTVDAFNPNGFYVYSLDRKWIEDFEDYMYYPTLSEGYRMVSRFDVETQVPQSLLWSTNPVSIEDRAIIITQNPLATVNGHWHSYRPYPVTVSLMGISPAKDFDFTVYDSSTLDFKSQYWYKREGDASTRFLEIDAGESSFISSRGSYEIIDGTGGVNIGGTIESYLVTDPSSPFRFNTFFGSATIEATTDTLITYNALDGSASFVSYREGVSEEDIEEYFSSDQRLRYPLKTPYITKWVGTGLDVRGNPLRLMLTPDLLDASSNFIPTAGNVFRGEISFPSYKYLSPGDKDWESYVYYDINDTASYVENGETKWSTFKDLIFDYPYVDVFSKIVYSTFGTAGTKNRTSIAYFNEFKASIDTLISGMSMSFTLEQSAKNQLNPRNWDRYRVSFVSTPSRNRTSNKPIEIFINENLGTILIVWYQGNEVLNYSFRNSSLTPGSGTMDSSLDDRRFQSFITGKEAWTLVKMPFVVNTSNLAPAIQNIYGVFNEYSAAICSPYAQYNFNVRDDLYSIFNAYQVNQVVPPGAFQITTKSYDTHQGFVSYAFTPSSATFGQSVVNWSWNYRKTDNFYKNETTLLSRFETQIEPARNLIEYYIIRGEEVLRNSNFSTVPIFITLNSPRLYRSLYTYNGWYRPQFNEVLNFNSTEVAQLATTLQKDFTLANTNYLGQNNLNQVWFSKVVERVVDTTSGRAIDYIEELNPSKSLWDDDYFFLYDENAENPVAVPGFRTALEAPSFFGSKLPSLPQKLELDEWTPGTASVTSSADFIELTFNITRKMQDMFLSNTTFIQNWSGLSGVSQFIDQYVATTVVGYYNIDINKMSTRVWSKTHSGPLGAGNLAFTRDSTFTENIARNVTAQLSYVNGEFLYTARFGIVPNRTYFFEFTLFEK